MPWKGVTVSEQRQRFIEDYFLNYYTITELAERFNVSRKTAYKWIERYIQLGSNGYDERSRKPHSCPWQTSSEILDELIALKNAHANWGPKKLLDVMERRKAGHPLPSLSTAARILRKEGLVCTRRKYRRSHPGCPSTIAKEPNDIWGTDYKGQFRMKNGLYCFPQTASDLASRFILGCDGHPAVSYEKTRDHFESIFDEFGLPKRIRSDNGIPFASSALARLSKLSVWFIKLGIYPELIEPGEPTQNGIHERMHRTLKQETACPPGLNLEKQQDMFDRFIQEFNYERPHEAIDMKRPAEVYYKSNRHMPKQIEPYEYPGHYLVRRVSRSGTIRIVSKQIFVSSTLIEENIGFEEIDDGLYDMFFCFLLIGRFELKTSRIFDIVSRVGDGRSQLEKPGKV